MSLGSLRQGVQPLISPLIFSAVLARSGKSLAFLLPALRHMESQPPLGKYDVGVLVVAPTRELAAQTAKVAEEAAGNARMRSLCVYGGVPKPPQQKALAKGVALSCGSAGVRCLLCRSACACGNSGKTCRFVK